jgi:hypothetical protein
MANSNTTVNFMGSDMTCCITASWNGHNYDQDDATKVRPPYLQPSWGGGVNRHIMTKVTVWGGGVRYAPHIHLLIHLLTHTTHSLTLLLTHYPILSLLTLGSIFFSPRWLILCLFLAYLTISPNLITNICAYLVYHLIIHSLFAFIHTGTGMLHPHTLHPCMFCPCMIHLHTLFPNVLISLYISSLNESQPKELHQPCIGWAFSLT